MTKKVLFLIVCIAVVFFLGKSLNPFDPRMFDFHDDTQPARIEQFTKNITSGIIPPRLGPDLSQGLGFPVFNFYAPFSYWITTGLHLMGIPIPLAIKTSFLLAVILSFVAMYLLLKRFFSTDASLLGGVVYASSLWFAIEIFVRGNLGEIWFLVLFPLSLFILHLHSEKRSKTTFFLAVLILSALFTVHNVLSLISLLVTGLFILLLPPKKQLFLAFIIALALSSYFLIPALIESHLTYASYVAEKTNYHDHFLCAWQIWSAPHWEFGGSGPGCDTDTMPFTLGKFHIVLGLLGIILFFLRFKHEKKHRKLFSFLLFVGVISLFLTMYQSSLIWDILAPVFSLFQFPWRFLVFASFLFAFFSGYLIHTLNIPYKKIVVLALMSILLFTSSKYFSKPWLYSVDEYNINLASSKYISQKGAYHMAEYLPKSADYNYWRSIENKPLAVEKPGGFQKEYTIGPSGVTTIDIHYFPFWQIKINNQVIIPNKFDLLGRPIINGKYQDKILAIYQETLVEKLGNFTSLIAAIFLMSILIYKPIWNKLKALLK